MTEKFVDLQPRQLLGKLAVNWRVVAACVAIGIALAAVRLVLGGVSYSATSQVLVGQPLTLASLTSTSAGGGVDQARLVDLVKRLIESDTTAAKVEKRLDVSSDDYELSVAAATTTNVMGLTATASDPEVAQKVANGFATFYLKDIRSDNAAKVRRASAGIRAEIDALDSQLIALGSSPVVNNQRALLTGQKLQLENRLTQVKLAGKFDPAGGARLVQVAERGESSMFGIVASLILGGLFGALLSLVVIAVREFRAGPAADSAYADEYDEEPETAYDEDVAARSYLDVPEPARA